MKVKKEASSPTKANKAESFRCGDCLHFKHTPHRTHKQVCSNEGIRHFAEAPRCYTPDYTKIISNIDEFMQVVTFFSSRTPQQKKILLGMLRVAPSGRKLKMGTKVIFNLRNRDYIGNYIAAYVVGYTSSGELVLAGSPEKNKRGQVFFAYLKDDKSLLTTKEWKKHYVELVAKGRINDPKIFGRKDITDSVKEDTYEVPTIDNAPKENTKLKKVNKRTSELGELIGFSF